MVSKKGRGLCVVAAFVAGITALIVSGNGLVFGQEFSATMSGVVHDVNGGLVPGVGVTAKHTESGLTRTVVTNETGSYRMPALPVGEYEVTAELSGFKQQVRRGITLVVAQEAVVNLTLDIGDLKEQNHRDGGGPDREHDHEFHLRPGHRRTGQRFAAEWAEFPGADEAQLGRDYQPIEYRQWGPTLVLDRGQAARSKPLHD